MIGIDVRTNAKFVVAEFRQLKEDIQLKATTRALNRALDQTTTETSRQIRKVYNLKHKAVMSGLRKNRAGKRGSKLTAVMTISGATIPLIEFDARWTQKTKIGATFRVKRGGGRGQVKGAFIGIHGNTGKKGVFVRVGKERYPIRTLRSIGLPQAFVNKTVIAAVERIAAESFDKNFRQQLKFLSNRSA